MDLIAHWVVSPRSASFHGTVTAVLAAIAIFGFGAPPWILVPVIWVGLTMYGKLDWWANQRLGRL